MQLPEKETWISNVLDSMDGMHAVTPPGNLFGVIEQRIRQGKKTISFIPVSTLTAAAASVAVLLMLNILVINHKPKQPENSLQSVVKYYDLNNDAALGL